MENPRPEKVGVVTEVRERLDAAGAAILTEYRGLSVGELAELRRVLATVGGDYKVYKNTLVKLAIAG
ncbi:MAG TPA: 50S ribosomal protein L10, partial [Acidimicrobiales bacterium]|nr:50S ribosomal protein L10 [Acidimicrobiales bacterium]